MTLERLKELWQPIAQGLFGEEGATPARYRVPHYEVRPVGMIVEDLVTIPDELWAKYAFAREPLNGKFNDEQRLELTRQALACGREYAEKLIAEYGPLSPEEMAKKMGMIVDYPEMPQSTDRVMFAEFRDPNKIHIFMDGIRKGRVLLTEPGVAEALTDKLDIPQLLIGHELFHHVEEKYRKEVWTRTYKIELWAIKPFHNRSGVAVLGEIAAMAFTQTLTGLPYSPYVMDAFLVYGYNPEVASGLYEEMMERAGREPRHSEEK